jgi:hypothetical protein
MIVFGDIADQGMVHSRRPACRFALPRASEGHRGRVQASTGRPNATTGHGSQTMVVLSRFRLPVEVRKDLSKRPRQAAKHWLQLLGLLRSVEFEEARRRYLVHDSLWDKPLIIHQNRSLSTQLNMSKAVTLMTTDMMQGGEEGWRLKWSEMETAEQDPCTHKRRQAKPSFRGRRSVWGRPSLLNVFNIAQARSFQ